MRTIRIRDDATIETRAPTRVTSPAIAAHIHFDQNGILIAINAHFDNALHLARCITLAPQALARAGPIMRNAGFKRETERLGIHISDHENFMALGIAGDADDQPIAIKLWRETGAFFDLSFGTAEGEGKRIGHAIELSLGPLRRQTSEHSQAGC